MVNWLHHLFNPHCDVCEHEKHYIAETLKLLLEQERAEKFRLLNLLMPDRITSARSDDTVDISSLRRNPRTMMRELERNSADEAERIRKRTMDEKISSLEKEAEVG